MQLKQSLHPNGRISPEEKMSTQGGKCCEVQTKVAGSHRYGKKKAEAKEDHVAKKLLNMGAPGVTGMGRLK